MEDLEFYNGKVVVVTGSSGFKGTWLSLWLRELGAEVIGYDIKDGDDVRNYNSVLATISECEPDVIFHLAAQALVLESYKDPYYTFDTNVRGTLNILEAIRHTPSVKAAVMITSDKCYQNTEKAFGYREDDPLGGKDPYSASKSAAEIVIQSYIQSFSGGANIASARAGNCIGSGDWSENRLVPDCIRALQSNHPIVVRNPYSTRPWQYVLEPLYGYLLLGKKLSHSWCSEYQGAWNFGSLYSMPVRDVVRGIILAWGSGSYTTEMDASSKESDCLCLDSAKSKHYLGWQTKLDAKTMLEWTVDDYKNPTKLHNLERIQEYMRIKND
jgi:CDP-glucose 4,6-dehydratase